MSYDKYKSLWGVVKTHGQSSVKRSSSTSKNIWKINMYGQEKSHCIQSSVRWSSACPLNYLSPSKVKRQNHSHVQQNKSASWMNQRSWRHGQELENIMTIVDINKFVTYSKGNLGGAVPKGSVHANKEGVGMAIAKKSEQGGVI